MKELSNEEKVKRYDEVAKEVKDFFEGKQKMCSDVTKALENLFPELKEPEDERIRKNLKYLVENYMGTGGYWQVFWDRNRKVYCLA